MKPKKKLTRYNHLHLIIILLLTINISKSDSSSDGLTWNKYEYPEVSVYKYGNKLTPSLKEWRLYCQEREEICIGLYCDVGWELQKQECKQSSHPMDILLSKGIIYLHFKNEVPTNENSTASQEYFECLKSHEKKIFQLETFNEDLAESFKVVNVRYTITSIWLHYHFEEEVIPFIAVTDNKIFGIIYYKCDLINVMISLQDFIGYAEYGFWEVSVMAAVSFAICSFLSLLLMKNQENQSDFKEFLSFLWKYSLLNAASSFKSSKTMNTKIPNVVLDLLIVFPTFALFYTFTKSLWYSSPPSVSVKKILVFMLFSILLSMCFFWIDGYPKTLISAISLTARVVLRILNMMTILLFLRYAKAGFVR